MVLKIFTKAQEKDIAEHASSHRMTLVILRSEKPPTELVPIIASFAKRRGFSLKRVYSAASSDFGFAEFNSNRKILIVLWVGDVRTEFVSVSETDEAHLREIEESIHSSNFYSDLVREGT